MWSRDVGQKRGFPIVVSAPSGTGKTTICRRVASCLPGVSCSISATTRPPREGEVDGVDYDFLDEQTFRSWIRDRRFCEWAVVHGHYYGTVRKNLEEALSRGSKVIMALDVNGGEAIGRLYEDAVLVYLLPPSEETLRERLLGRGTEGKEAMEKRIEDARKELSRVGNYHYVIVNRSVDQSVERIKSIVVAEECRVERQDLSGLLRSLGDLEPAP